MGPNQKWKNKPYIERQARQTRGRYTDDTENCINPTGKCGIQKIQKRSKCALVSSATTVIQMDSSHLLKDWTIKPNNPAIYVSYKTCS